MPTAVTRSAPGVREITLHSEVTDRDSEQLRTLLIAAMWHEKLGHIVVTIADDAVLDPTAIGTLLAAVDIAADQRLSFELRCANPDLAHQLTLAGLTLANHAVSY